MATALSGGEGPGTRWVCGVAERCLKRAAAALRSESVSDADVHRARRLIKKARAALRLLRATVSNRAFRRADRALRAASRPLNALRDAYTLLLLLEKLRSRHTRLRKDAAVAAVVRDLSAELAAAWKEGGRGSVMFLTLVRRLRRVRRRLQGWTFPRDAEAGLGEGLKGVYRAGRRAARKVLAAPNDQRMHRWRRHVKYLWHAQQILRPITHRRLSGLAQQLRELGDWLGEDHDLALLQRRVEGQQVPAEGLLRLIAQRRRSLQRRALAAGRRLYAARVREVLAQSGIDADADSAPRRAR